MADQKGLLILNQHLELAPNKELALAALVQQLAKDLEFELSATEPHKIPELVMERLIRTARTGEMMHLLYRVDLPVETTAQHLESGDWEGLTAAVIKRELIKLAYRFSGPDQK